MKGRVVALRLCRALGLFALSRRLCRGRLLILCYHGVAQRDEHRWAPQFFVSEVTFLRRLDHLQRLGIPVVPLDQGIARIRRGAGGPLAVALTFDDGFHNFAVRALPALRARGMPAMVYVTSYYVRHATRPVFDVAVDYMLWSRRGRRAPGTLIGESDWLETAPERARRRSLDRIYAYAEQLDPEGKEHLLQALAAALEFDYDSMVRERLLCLMSAEELRECGGGVRLGLHTHRHRTPDDPAALARELQDNRAALRGLGVTVDDHFCYPSGEWAPWMWDTLARCGVVSAATCERGLVGPDTPLLALPRFLDGEGISDVEFEAWVSGFVPLVRQWLGRGPRRGGTRGASAAIATGASV